MSLLHMLHLRPQAEMPGMASWLHRVPGVQGISELFHVDRPLGDRPDHHLGPVGDEPAAALHEVHRAGSSSVPSPRPVTAPTSPSATIGIAYFLVRWFIVDTHPVRFRPTAAGRVQDLLDLSPCVWVWVPGGDSASAPGP